MRSKVESRTESEHSRVRNAGIPTDVHVVLKDWLNEKVSRQMSCVVNFNRFFRPESGQTLRRFSSPQISQTLPNRQCLKRIGDFAVDKPERNHILRARCNRSVVAHTCCDLAVQPVDIVRTPVKSESSVQAAV